MADQNPRLRRPAFPANAAAAGRPVAERTLVAVVAPAAGGRPLSNTGTVDAPGEGGRGGERGGVEIQPWSLIGRFSVTYHISTTEY